MEITRELVNVDSYFNIHTPTFDISHFGSADTMRLIKWCYDYIGLYGDKWYINEKKCLISYDQSTETATRERIVELYFKEESDAVFFLLGFK